MEISDFYVSDRSITQAYVSDSATKGNKKLNAGNFVVLELEPLPMTDQGAELVHDG